MIVRSAAALARLDAGGGSRSARCLAEIDQAADRASALTRQLLAFSRKQELAPRRLELCELVRGLRPMLERALGDRVCLDVALSADSVFVEVDPPQTEHALLNLVVNARDAMPAGGVLSISISAVELGGGAAATAGVSAGRYARLTVSDNGCGMSNEVRQRVFEPFFTTKEHGTGLGLALVYGAVRQSRGSIEVDSEPGRGTIFRILLPRVEEPAAS
jgi:signal transduction histidine kinase